MKSCGTCRYYADDVCNWWWMMAKGQTAEETTAKQEEIKKTSWSKVPVKEDWGSGCSVFERAM